MLPKSHLIYILLIIFSYERFCYCSSSGTSNTDPNKNESKTPSQLVEEIVRKVCNMTIHTLAASSNEEKDKLISKIENKLHKSAKALQYNDNYVQLIMKGVRLIAYNNTRKNDDTPRAHIEIINKPNKPSKTQLVNNIAQKVEFIAKAYSKSKKSGDRNKILTDIQKVIAMAANKKHKELHDQHNQMKDYNSIIVQGIAQAMEKIKEARRMELELVNKKLTDNSEHSTDMFVFKKKSHINQEAIQHIAARPGDHVNDLRALSCREMKNHVCMNIKLLNVLECPADNTELSIEKLCDGMMDCSDSSDERNCTGRVLDIVRNASGLMTEIEFAITRQCYPPLVENDVISKEKEILREVLRTQVKFIEKHSMDDHSPVSNIRNFPTNTDKARSAANEVVVVIHTLSLALRSALCLDHSLMNTNKTLNSENSGSVSRTNAISEENTISEDKPPVKGKLSSCVCNGQYCLHSNCPEGCANVCRHKYSLGRWKCDAVVEGKSVSLDEICDGKLDCFDESDENDCFQGSGFTKFEATKMYQLIIETILLKIKSERVESIRRLLINLINSVRNLQTLTAKRNPDKLEIKNVRDQSFAGMVLIYEGHLMTSKSMLEMQKVYGDLINLNDKLISAIKRSHTGNDRIVTADGCYCTNHKCSLPRCSKICVRACVAEPILTRYYCGGSKSYDDSIIPSAVCNDKYDCIDKDDEDGCKKDICRKHHLVLLRHTIRNIGDERNVKGTSVGEALNSWKTKVTATLRIAESEDGDRPTPKIMRDIVKAMLRDLLMIYAGMEEDYWMPTSLAQMSFGFPAQALKAGSDLDGSGLYLGRAHHEGDIVPAKVIPSANACYIAYNGEEILKDEFELLIPTTSAIAWYPCHSGVVPPGAVEAGVTAEGETLFFGRVAHEGCITPGKIHPSHNACYFPFNGEERVSSEYECLVLHHDGNFMAR